MFTGIIEAKAKIQARTQEGISIERPSFFTDLKIGSSVCVSGACLSAIELTKDAISFHVVPETWAKTKLGSLKEGKYVNLERSLSPSGRFDGHIVQGHIEGVASVISLASVEPHGMMLSLELPEDLVPLVVEKGSIAIDGVSLTVASLVGSRCEVALIPMTLTETTLGLLKEGDKVNIETDIFGRYVRRFLALRS